MILKLNDGDLKEFYFIAYYLLNDGLLRRIYNWCRDKDSYFSTSYIMLSKNIDRKRT